ncbi:TPA: hypothetical protein RVR74_000446 [Aeromonas salmonicida]|uniref:hypothetical protein n=1 Tax=Aeromonas salmonicida TaxID=645 RepID=UPI001F17B16C|nr:hypothetical protein [Aeromonas salmonicida]MCE9936367.1 hypothetical protein [Aeromonas salmonicida]HEA3088167.1 hypothetical protein [Aeromonas salmonicida]
MNIEWMLLALMLAWAAFLALVWLSLREWLAEEEELGLEWDEFEVEPRLVSACRELTELAAKTKEASHG